MALSILTQSGGGGGGGASSTANTSKALKSLDSLSSPSLSSVGRIRNLNGKLYVDKRRVQTGSTLDMD